MRNNKMVRKDYRVWVHRRDGTKFVGNFKSRRDAKSWSNAFNKGSKRFGGSYGVRIGNQYVRRPSKPRTRRVSNPYAFSIPRFRF